MLDTFAVNLLLATACSTADLESPWFWVRLGWLIHLVTFLAVFAHCLRRQRESSSTLLWIFIAWSFPGLGPLLYLCVGVDRVSDKGFEKHIADQRLLAERQAREKESLPLAYWHAVHESAQGQPPTPFGQRLNRAMDAMLPEYPLLSGNHLELLRNGDEAFPRIFAAMRCAQHHIHLQSFIIRNDSVGQQLLELAAAKAREGVHVRLMYDRFGSTQAFFTRLFKHYRDVPNLRIVGWTQANPLKRQFQINLRNHRKIVVVDGREAFLGGINFSVDNTTRGWQAPIRDYHFALTGAVVQELQYTFMRDWYFITHENPEELLTDEYFPLLPPAGDAMVRVVNSGPTREMEIAADAFFMAAVHARHEIVAVTPYFVPPHDILRALRSAALLGVRVRLLVPEKSNHFCVGFAGQGLYESLLQAGVRIFEMPPPFLHGKAFIVDDVFALIGTANLDVRSLRLNYETNVAVHDEAFVNRLKRAVLTDINCSREIDLSTWQNRPLRQRMAENLSLLMRPIL